MLVYTLPSKTQYCLYIALDVSSFLSIDRNIKNFRKYELNNDKCAMFLLFFTSHYDRILHDYFYFYFLHQQAVVLFGNNIQARLSLIHVLDLLLV